MNAIISATLPATEELDDGVRVTIRPIVPEDAGEILEGFSQLSPRSRRQRFHCGMGHLNAHQLEFLSHPDQLDHIALCMHTQSEDPADGIGIGVARCVRAEDTADTAEVAVTVVDRWQGRGAGTVLLQHLAGHAWRAGIRYWRLSHFADNRAILALIRRNATVVERRAARDGIIEVICALSSPDEEQPGFRDPTEMDAGTT